MITLIKYSQRAKDHELYEQAILKLEKKIFPKHESMRDAIPKEIRKPNTLCFFAVTEIELDGSTHCKSSIIKKPTVVGYIILSFNTVERSYYLSKLAVEPQHRGKGIGTSLLREVWSHLARQANKDHNGDIRITLHVDGARKDAIHVYTKFNFAEVKAIRDYYCPGRDAILMESII
jgi:ribosomal protein S18 acetylase RimI-like enzyme